MRKILTFTWKELYTTLSDRNLILIMFVTPIVLSTIMGLAFSGLGGDSASTAFTNIPIAIVNLDEGFRLDEQFPESDQANAGSLSEMSFELGGQTLNLGELLLQNENLEIEESDLSAQNVAFNFGDQLTGILLSDTVTTSNISTGTSPISVGFNLDDLTCPLIEEDESDVGESPFGYEGTLADLFDPEEVADALTARTGVEQGDYAAAIIIPPDFSKQLAPQFEPTDAVTGSASGADVVEIYADRGQSISGSIVRAVVEGIVNQFVRISVAMETGINSTIDTVPGLVVSSKLDLARLDLNLVADGLRTIDASVIEPLGCLLKPGAGNIQLTRKPLDQTQEGSAFGFIMVVLGSAQAIFFALFTGIFGMNSIYIERKNWTLQRLIVSPTPRVYILLGKLLGNLVVVAAQLSILFLSFTIISSIVEGEVTFIWGTNVPLLGLVILAISLFVSAVGVLVVGLAATPEQVQIFGPIISSGLGVLGGSFGFQLPPEVARFSPIWWGTGALRTLAEGESTIGPHLLVLLGIGMLLLVVGAILFRRKLEL